MAKQIKNAPDVETLTHALCAIIDPLVAVIETTDRPGQDTGQDNGVMLDNGLKYLLDGMIRTVHRQLYGQINTATGNKIPNTKERFDVSTHKMAELREKYATNEDAMYDDPAFIEAVRWLRLNEERFLAYQGIFSALCNTYREYFREDWKYTELTRNTVSPERAERNKELREYYKSRYAAKA